MCVSVCVCECVYALCAFFVCGRVFVCVCVREKESVLSCVYACVFLCIRPCIVSFGLCFVCFPSVCQYVCESVFHLYLRVCVMCV